MGADHGEDAVKRALFVAFWAFVCLGFWPLTTVVGTLALLIWLCRIPGRPRRREAAEYARTGMSAAERAHWASLR